MSWIVRVTATFFGAGYSPVAPGTAGALLAILMWGGLFGLRPNAAQLPHDLWIQLAIILAYLFAGVWATKSVQSAWGKDPSKVVVDEAVGVWIAVYALPAHWSVLLCGFVLFRVFDIWKPLGIKRFDNMQSAWGVMLDDVLAGFYAWLITGACYKNGWIGPEVFS